MVIGVLALLLHGGAAFVTISQSRFGAQLDTIRLQTSNVSLEAGSPLIGMPMQQQLGYLWSLPDDPQSHHGLGGGIAWNWDSSLCDSLVPKFREDFFFWPFVTCRELKAAMHRGFNSWSDNHPGISFLDVSDECTKIGTPGSDCALSEVFITTLASQASAEAAMADVGEAMGSTNGESAALAHSAAVISTTFRHTNGRRAKGLMIETIAAVISFNTGLCWYLDSTFCSMFHNLKTVSPLSPTEILWIGRGIIGFIWIVAFMWVLVQIFGVLQQSCKQVHGKRNKCRAGIDHLNHQSVIGTSLRLILLIAPPVFYLQIFMPCWECFDFEAAATHEIGHVLGLSHPDNVASSLCTEGVCGPSAGENVFNSRLAAGNRHDAASCLQPWLDVLPGVPGAAAPAEVRPSIMKALTQHNPSVCLTQDDLEALNTLYPDCSHGVTVPVCYKLAHNIGWVRFGVYTLAPVLLIIMLMLTLTGCLRKHQLKRLKSAHALVREKSRDLRAAKNAVQRHSMVARNLQQELSDQKAGEEERVEKKARRMSMALVQQELFKRGSPPPLKLGSTREGSSEGPAMASPRKDRWGSFMDLLASPRRRSSASMTIEQVEPEPASGGANAAALARARGDARAIVRQASRPGGARRACSFTEEENSPLRADGVDLELGDHPVRMNRPGKGRRKERDERRGGPQHDRTSDLNKSTGSPLGV